MAALDTEVEGKGVDGLEDCGSFFFGCDLGYTLELGIGWGKQGFNGGFACRVVLWSESLKQ